MKKNILFLTLIDFNSISEDGIYTDVLRALAKKGHDLCVISPVERSKGVNTHMITDEGARILKLRIGNTQKTNIIEKGISTLTIEPQFISAIKKYFSDIRFDLVMYSTPPITLCSAVEYVKKRDGAKTFLMLKDIFPQNAVDLGMLSKTGIKAPLYRMFREKEKKLYRISDHIGCMSEANVEYVLKNNSEIQESKVSVFPNCKEVKPLIKADEAEITAIREKYGIPKDAILFIYGGNLGKPQGMEHILKCLRSQKNNKRAFFLIIGSGTESKRLEAFINQIQQPNIKYIPMLPKEEYKSIVKAADVGMLFLDCRFTIPNFPSRLLDYMQEALPVLACTDKNTDVGKVVTENGFGWWCESRDVADFVDCVKMAMKADRTIMGENGYKYLNEEYNVEKVVERLPVG